MKMKVSILCGCLLLNGSWLRAQFPPNGPIGENFFPVELLKQGHEAIGLTEEQKAFLLEEVQKTEERMVELQQQLKKEGEAMAALTKNDRLKEPTVLAHADKILNVEREIKRTQLALLVRIKNKLTPEQQAQLKELKAKMSAFQAKMRKVQEAAQQWQREGRDLSALESLKGELEPLMQEKKFQEAEAVLDRALKMLEGKQQK